LTTPLEAARRALAERLGDALPVDVLRNEPEPNDVEEPVAVLTDGEASAAEACLSPPTWDITAVSTLALYVASRFATERDAFLDGAVELTEAALEADRTLGGTVRWAEASPPRKALDRTLGAAVVATAEVDLTLTYESDRSSG
jgi:hypothetical protein